MAARGAELGMYIGGTPRRRSHEGRCRRMREDFRDERVYAQARADEWLWARAKAMGISRRRLLGLLAAGAGAAAGLGQVARGRTARAAPATDLVVKPTPRNGSTTSAATKKCAGRSCTTAATRSPTS